MDEDDEGTDSILSGKKFRSILQRVGGQERLGQAEHGASTVAKIAHLTEEETRSLSTYTLKINSNLSPPRSKTNCYRKSNMSSILGRESRVLKKLKQRVELQYKLSAAQLQYRGWQTASSINKVFEDSESTKSVIEMNPVQ